MLRRAVRGRARCRLREINGDSAERSSAGHERDRVTVGADVLALAPGLACALDRRPLELG